MKFNLNFKDKYIKLGFNHFIKCSLLCVVTVSVSFPIYAGTVDDVRELLGRDRVDKQYSESEVISITKDYMLAEKNNIIAEMFKLGEEIEMDDYEADKIQLISAINNKKAELNKAYSTVESVDTVLRIKTELDALMNEVSRLKELGYTITVDFEPNPYTEEYMKIQEMVNKLGQQYDIGDVGIDMRSPVLNSFVITSPFGTRLDPFTGETSVHNALDLGAKHREPIIAQWNGVVTYAFFSESGGNMIIIAHGSDLQTTYMHMDELNVKAGDIINQYDVIGYAGTTGRSTGTHLHLEIKLDGIPVNPLMLYGNKGLNSLKSWISLNPNQLEDTEFMKNVKDRPDDVVFKVEEVYRGYDAFIIPTYIRGAEAKELDYKEKMKLKEEGLITIKELNLPLTEADKESLLNGGDIVTLDNVINKHSFGEDGKTTNKKYTIDGKIIDEPILPNDYAPPNPGFPLLSVAHGEEEDNANIDESLIEDFEEYGQIYIKGGLMQVTKEDEKDSSEDDDENDVNENKEFHLGD